MNTTFNTTNQRSAFVGAPGIDTVPSVETERQGHRHPIGRWLVPAGVAALAAAAIVTVAVNVGDDTDGSTSRPAFSGDTTSQQLVQQSIEEGLAAQAASGAAVVSSQQLVQQSIEQGLAERAAASTAGAVSSYQLVQDSIEQGLAERAAGSTTGTASSWKLVQDSIDQGLAERAGK